MKMNLKGLLKYSYIPIISCLFVLLDMFVRLFVGMRLISPRAIVFSFLFGLLFAGITECFKRKRSRQIYCTILIFIACLLALSQNLYYRFFSDFYSFTSLSNIREFMTVKGETAKAIQLEFLVYPILAVVFIALNWLNPWLEEKKRNLRVSILCVLIFTLGFFGVKATFINKMEDKTQVYLTDDYLYQTLFNKSNALERFGLFAYSQRDILRIVENKMKKANPQELEIIDAYFDENQREKQNNEYTGLFEGKNVVLILAESFNRWGINEEITPTLYKMKNEGIYFENYYSPKFDNSTIDSEFMINTGLIPPLDYGNVAYEFPNNDYSLSLANLFKKKGYTSYSYHNSIGSFYNRYQFHEALGYDHFYDSEELGISVPSNFGYNWALDFDLFDKVSEKIINEDLDQPFFAYLITVSTHTPYDDNRIQLKENVEKVKEILDADSQVQYYMAAAMDLDSGIELMCQRFEEEGILEDTVFVLFGDHYSYGMYHDIIWTYDTQDAGDYETLYNVPLMIWTPGMKAETIENDCGQLDVYPTITNLFNLDSVATYNFGNDALNNEQNTIVLASRGAWRDKNLVYRDNGIAQLLNEEADISYISSTNSELIEKIDVFQKLIEQDYFATDDFKKRIGE